MTDAADSPRIAPELRERTDPLTGQPRTPRKSSARRQTQAAASPPTIDNDAAATGPPQPVFVEEPTDIDVPGESFTDRMRSWIREPKEDGAKPPRTRNVRGNKLEVDSDELSSIFLVPLLSLAFMAVPKELRMNDRETAAVCKPLASILIRHVKALQYIGPDFIDGAAIIGVCVAYSRRIASENQQRKNYNGPSVVQPVTQAEYANNGTNTRQSTPATPGDIARPATSIDLASVAIPGNPDGNGTGSLSDYLAAGGRNAPDG